MHRRWFALIIIVVGLLTFSVSLPNDFVWDDEEQIVNNSYVHSLNNWPHFFQGSTFNPGGSTQLGGMYYKPLMPFAYSIMYTIAGQQAWFFRAFQISLHIANTWLLFMIWIKMLQPLIKNQSTRQWWSLTASLLFLVHPINTETVVYLASLQDVLFMFFGLVALNVAQNNSKKWWHYLLLGTSLLLSLLAKESGILFIPMVGLLLLLWPQQKPSKQALTSVRNGHQKTSPTPTAIAYSLLIMIVGSIYAILRFGVGGVGLSKHGLSPITKMSISERLLSMPKINWFYWKTYFWPQKLLIAQHWVVEQITWSNFIFPLLFSIATAGTLLITAWWLWRRRHTWWRWWLFWTVWLILGISLHLQIFPLDMTVADRWFYFPQIGLLALAVSILQNLLQLKSDKKESSNKIKKLALNNKTALLAVWMLILISLSIRTIIRSTTWESGLKLYSHDSQYNQNAFDLSNNYGVELYRNGQIEQAKEQFERSTKIAPQWWTNWNNLGAINEQQNDLSLAEKHYRLAIQNGDYYLAYINLAQILIKQEKHEEAIDFLTTKALPRFQQNPQLWDLLFITSWQTKNFQLAKQAANRAWQLEPSTQRQQQLQLANSSQNPSE